MDLYYWARSLVQIDFLHNPHSDATPILFVIGLLALIITIIHLATE